MNKFIYPILLIVVLIAGPGLYSLAVAQPFSTPYSSMAAYLKRTGGTMTGDITMSGADTQIIFTIDNDAVTPSITLEPGTGFYASADNTISWAVNGLVNGTITSTNFQVLSSNVLLFGGATLNATNGYVTGSGSANAWMYQGQDAIQDARLIGSADAASEIASSAGTKYTDGQGGNTASIRLMRWCTDCDGTPAEKAWVGGDGSMNLTGGLVIGSGTAILKHLSSTASLDFGIIAGGVCAGLTIGVTGAADGDTTDVGIPNALASTANLVFDGWVSSSGNVTVRACCTLLAGNCADPAAATVRADVWAH